MNTQDAITQFKAGNLTVSELARSAEQHIEVNEHVISILDFERAPPFFTGEFSQGNFITTFNNPLLNA